SKDIWGLAIGLIIGAIAPAISEEFLFRGLVQRSFERKLRPVAAIALAGTIFGTMHFQPVNLIPLAGLGIFFGYVAWSMGSIYPTIFGHFIFNALTIVALYVSGDSAADISSSHTPAEFFELLPLALGSLGVFLLTVFWFRSHRLTRLAAESDISQHDI